MKSLYWRLAYQNIFKNRRIYFPYIISATLLIAMSYIVTSLSYNESFTDTLGGQTVLQFLNLGTFVIMVFAIIFLFYTNSFMIRSRRKELGLYNILGLEKRHVILIMFCELIYTLCFSVLVGLLLGVILDKLAFMILLNLMGNQVPLGFSFSFKALVINALFYSTILLATFIYNVIQVIRYTAINLLKSDSVGEKEPKAKFILALIGFVCLGFGYGIALAVKDPIEAVLLFFFAVILVIIGTYLLFTVGVTLILKALKKKRSYYYKTSHFISVSMLLYRMKKNAVGLANICILSTMVLVMISSTSALWFFANSAINNLYPFDSAVKIENIDLNEVSKADAIVEAKIKDSGMTFDKYFVYNDVYAAASYKDSSTIIRNEAMSNGFILHGLTVDAYNIATGSAIKLNRDEIIILCDSDLKFEKTITIFDKSYQVIEVKDNLTPNIPQTPIITSGEIQVIVSDTDALLDFSSTVNRNYGFDSQAKDKLKDLTYYIMDDFIKDLADISRIEVYQQDEVRNLILGMYAGLFFLGVFLSVVFIMAMVLIIYYKQIQEGSEDEKRFKIMRRVGLTNKDISKTINSQVWILFFMPLIVAVIHMLFAYNIIEKLLSVASMSGSFEYFPTFIISIIIFMIFYSIIYRVTSRIYYRMVTVA